MPNCTLHIKMTKCCYYYVSQMSLRVACKEEWSETLLMHLKTILNKNEKKKKQKDD